MIVSLIGGIILAVSAALFVWNLVSLQRARQAPAPAPMRYAVAVHPPVRVPRALNSFALWNVLVAILMLAAYGYPIAQFFIDPPPEAVVHRVN
ncbi:MAG TPA: hypothetical protein VF582_03750 [Allosphingosinicella sp.]